MPGHGDGSFDVTAYDLELDYRVASNHLDGRATLTVVAAADLSGIELDLAGLSVDKVTVDGRRPARFGLRGRRLFVRIAGGWAAGEEHEVVIRYSGQPRPLRGPWGEVGWEELTDGAIVAAQPNGAPSWFPCNDRPSTKATYRFVVTTEPAYTVVANGRLVDRAVAASRTTWVYELDQPMATYLATVQIGRYDAQALDGDAVPQTVFAPARCREQVADELSRQPEMMSVFVEWFGAYPFDRYDVVVTDDDLEIPLEAQGLSIFGANHLDGTHHLERLVAHELAHQWFGNSLTLTTWSDIWLHEGFACYAEWLWSEESGGPTAADLAEKYYRRLADQPEDIVIAEPGPDLMFDDRLYKRGALTLHAVRTVLGDKAFAAVLLDWVRDHRHGSVTTAELERRFIAAGDVADLLVSWLHRPELPPLP